MILPLTMSATRLPGYSMVVSTRDRPPPKLRVRPWENNAGQQRVGAECYAWTTNTQSLSHDHHELSSQLQTRTLFLPISDNIFALFVRCLVSREAIDAFFWCSIDVHEVHTPSPLGRKASPTRHVPRSSSVVDLFCRLPTPSCTVCGSLQPPKQLHARGRVPDLGPRRRYF